jgi:predicted DNA-binding protein with PD1-like motif
MKCCEGTVGRVFVVKFEHGDDFLGCLASLAKEKNIKAGIVHFIGALNNAEIVVGPEKNTLPPTPMWKKFDDGRELLGIGTIFWKGDEPKIHIHSSIGRGENANLGCIRKNANVYLIIEAVVFEIAGVKAKRVKDEKTGLDLLEF